MQRSGIRGASWRVPGFRYAASGLQLRDRPASGVSYHAGNRRISVHLTPRIPAARAGQAGKAAYRRQQVVEINRLRQEGQHATPIHRLHHH
jgi:hypothetical protein